MNISPIRLQKILLFKSNHQKNHSIVSGYQHNELLTLTSGVDSEYSFILSMAIMLLSSSTDFRTMTFISLAN